MKRYIILLLYLSSFSLLFAAELDYKSLLPKLDEAIDSSRSFVEKRKARISMLKRQIDNTLAGEQRYGLSMKLFDEYKSFVNDSAVHYIEQCVSIAGRIGRKDLEGMSLSLLAYQCSNTGMYNEALEMLRRVGRGRLGKDGLIKYYLAYYHVYNEMGYYSIAKSLSADYYARSSLYRDSLYSVADRYSDDYMMVRTMDLFASGRYDEALKLNDVWVSVAAEDTRRMAIVAYYRQLMCYAKGDVSGTKYWLAVSALNDVGNAVMDQASLWTLAELLCKDGDLNRAYKYIRFSWDTATMFGARVRSQQVMPVLAVIEQDYLAEISNSNSKLRLFVTLVTLMAVLLLFLLIYVNRQRHRLLTARRELKDINKRLDKLNQDLKNANASLDDRNRELSSANTEMALTNAKLNDSNRVKEKFIGKFMVLCSSYIDKMDTLRKSVNKMAKARKLDEIVAWSKSTELKDKEIDELLANFDEAFIFLFPDFVNDFNALLREECRIVPPEKGRLNTSLRIFALIRLGIDDSSRIAEFLHYSVNTIYNYRARVKNGALNDRDDFEKNVRLLGLGNH